MDPQTSGDRQQPEQRQQTMQSSTVEASDMVVSVSPTAQQTTPLEDDEPGWLRRAGELMNL